ncbi:MAG: hypothetical protein F6K39_02045 [Okeania sp. SIO3B3]|nr:hypothetical protein [Okeania sp. SIO3B3]
MAYKQNHLLVTGSHRSGTSYTGAVLLSSQAYFQLLEPTNPVYGSTMADCWFPYARTQGDGGKYGQMVDHIFARRYNYRHYLHGSLPKRALKALFGSKASREALFYKYFGYKLRPMLIKDPLASFLAERMARHHSADVLMCLRHPMSFFGSAKVGGHTFDFNNFLNQPDLVADFLSDEEAHMHDNSLSYAERYGLLWHCINKVLLAFYDRRQEGERWHIHKHEDMCANPVQTFGDAFAAFGLELSPKLRESVTTKARPEFAYAWQAAVTPQEMEEVARFAKPLSDKLYPSESWNLDHKDDVDPKLAF